VQVRAERGPEFVHVRAEDTGSGGHGGDRLGGGEHHDRHRQLHGLDQRQAERGPPHRMQVDASTGERGVHLVLRLDVLSADHRVETEAGGECLCLHTEHVDRPDIREAGHEIGADHPATTTRFVDDDGAALELTGIAGTRVDDAVLDDGRRRGAVVPVQ